MTQTGRISSTDTGPKVMVIMRTTDKDLKTDIINVFKDLKEKMNTMRGEMEDIKNNNQKDLLVLKNISEMKNSLNVIRYCILEVRQCRLMNLKTQQKKPSKLKHREQNFSYAG